MFTNIIILFSSLFLLFTFGFAAELPDEYRKCKAGDTKCMKDIINIMIRDNFKMGRPEISLVPFDPLPFENMIVNTGGAAYRLDILVHEGFFEGIANLRLDNIELVNKDPRNGVIKYSGKAPMAYLHGNFTGDGQLIILPIHGKGYLEFKVSGIVMLAEMKTKIVQKNGEDYIKIKSIVTDGHGEEAFFHFENLFSNKQIEVEVNNVINQNSRQFLNDLQPSLMKAYSGLMVKLMQPLFDAVPYRKLFLEE